MGDWAIGRSIRVLALRAPSDVSPEPAAPRMFPPLRSRREAIIPLNPDIDPDAFGGTPFQKQVRRELFRVGMHGVQSIGGATPDQILEALRSTADGAGKDSFFANLMAVVQRDSDQQGSN